MNEDIKIIYIHKGIKMDFIEYINLKTQKVTMLSKENFINRYSSQVIDYFLVAKKQNSSKVRL